MRGSIRKRGATWTCTFDEPSPDATHKQRTKGGFKTRKSAQAFLVEQLARLDGGTYAAPAKLLHVAAARLGDRPGTILELRALAAAG